MFKNTKRDVLGFLTALSLSLVPAISQSAPVAAATTGTLFAVFGESKVVTLDPATGAKTVIADLSAPAPGVALSDLVSDSAGHRLFAQQTTYSFNPSVPTTYQLVTVNTQNHAVTVSPNLAQSVAFALAFDPSTGTLFGRTQCCPSQMVTIDSMTGVETSVVTLDGTNFSSMAVALSLHTIYMTSNSFTTFPPTSRLISFNTSTHALTAGPNLTAGTLLLAFDTSNGTLFGKTFCCPTHVARIDASTGAAAVLGTSDLGYGNSFAVDPASHTIFAMRDVLGAFSFDQYVASIDESTGAVSLSLAIPLVGGYIRSLAFESVSITPESIKTDVLSALASGAIDNDGIANSLLAKLDAAASARSSGQCSVAAEIYGDFISELNAQSGKHVAPATAATLISEAQFLIANCP